jgi:hypothetical protein
VKIHTDFLSSHFDLLIWTLESHVKIFNRKPEENFESCSAVSGQKNMIFKIVFIMMKIFTRVQKLDGTKNFKFNFSTHIIPKVIFIFPQIFKKIT